MATSVRTNDLQPDDLVLRDEGDEVVDHIKRGLAITKVWWVGWSKPEEFHPVHMHKVANR